jgi:hypothetical protein
MVLIAPFGLLEDPFYTTQSYLTMAIGVIGSLIILLLWTFKRAEPGILHIRYTKLLLLFIGFLAWEFITLFWVQNMHLATITLIQHSSFVVVFFLAINILSKKDLPVLLNALVVVLVLV